MIYKFEDYGVRINNAGVLQVIRRSDSKLMSDVDLTTSNAKIEADASSFNVGGTEEEDMQIIDSTNLNGNDVHTTVAGSLCKNNQSCFDIRNKTGLVKLTQSDTVIQLGELDQAA
jgi:hypothetical protein